MSTVAERKTALLLLTIPQSERHALLSELPEASAQAVATLLKALTAMPWAVAELAREVLAERPVETYRMPAITPRRIETLSAELSAGWLARALSANAQCGRDGGLAELQPILTDELRREIDRVGTLPAKFAEAIAAETAAILAEREAA